MRMLILIIVFIFLIILLWYLSVAKINSNNRINEQLYNLPSIEMVSIKDKLNYRLENKLHLPTIILYFNSECEFCLTELQEIKNKMHLLTDTRLFLVSSEPIETLNRLESKFRFNQYFNTGIYYCNQDTFLKYFRTLNTPSIIIYNESGNFKNRFNTITSIDSILSIIKE